MNLLDSHDTERLRWTLSPGQETTAEKELNPANVAEGKQRQRLASLIQFTVPGAPTVFYGDEVGITGDDDPDDRRTYPWSDKGGTPDQDLFTHYQSLNTLRSSNDVLVHGDFKVLLADDASQVVAYGRKTGNQAAVVIINRSSQSQSVAIPVTGYLPDGVVFTQSYVVGQGGQIPMTVTGGAIPGSVEPLSAVLLLTGNVDLAPPAAPTGLHVTAEGNGFVNLAWNSVAGSVGYNLYRSPLSGGGWVKVNGVNPISATDFADTGLQNARTYYYVVKALDAAGNEDASSNEVSALPHFTIGWANLQWPPTLSHTLSATDRTDDVFGQVWIDGVTSQPGSTSWPNRGGRVWSGRKQPGWKFGLRPGKQPALTRMTGITMSSRPVSCRSSTVPLIMLPLFNDQWSGWLYADLDGPIPTGSTPPHPGKMTVAPTGDTTPPAASTNLVVTSSPCCDIVLAWDAHPNTDGDLVGFEVYRDSVLLATITDPAAASYT